MKFIWEQPARKKDRISSQLAFCKKAINQIKEILENDKKEKINYAA